MEISIKLEVQDWSKFQSHLEKELPKTVKSWTNSSWFNIILWAVIAFAFMSIFEYIGEIHWPTAGFVTVFFVLFFALFLFNMAKLKKAYAPSENGVFVGEHTFVLDDEGIKSKGQGYEGNHAWTIVKRIERANGMILIYLDTANAYVFPENKLENPDLFYTYIKEKNKKI